MELTKISEIKPLMERHGFTFTKSLGQNFLINREIPQKIAESALISKDTLAVEIGPGIGCLTKELALRAGRVIAIELDKKLIPILAETLEEFDNVTVLNADAMKVDFFELCRGYDNVAVCANLPYYITTPILMRVLECGFKFSSVTVMVQKEVAQRLCADAGTEAYGAITAAVNYYADTRTMFGVSSGNFMPAPKVDSAVVRLVPKTRDIDKKTEDFFFRAVKAGFGQRRKTFANSAAAAFGMTKQDFDQILCNCGFDADIRAEKLSVEDFIRIAINLSEAKK